MNVRLADFIRREIDPILQAWEAFANSLSPGRDMDQTNLRDHAQGMLLEIADDLDTGQTDAEQDAKSKGHEPSDREEYSADLHGGERLTSGFSVQDTIAEFRALRASVVSLWTKTYPPAPGQPFEDITRFNEAVDQALARSLDSYSTLKEMETRLFGAILLATPDPICVLNRDGRISYANKAANELFAMDSKVIVGQSLLDLGYPFAADLHRHLEQVVANQSVQRGTFSHTFGSGPGERFVYILAPVLDEQRNTEATVCIIRDVTEQALAEERIWNEAHHDPLTTLPNRRLFMDRLEQVVNHAKRSSLPFGVLYIDLDGFKDVNDRLGHEAGDRLLCDVAKRLTGCVREEDTVARMGGDEFTVILTAVKQRKELEGIAQTIRDQFAAPFLIVEQPVEISISIGIAFSPRDGTSPADLLKAADQAMYVAKRDVIRPEEKSPKRVG